MLKTYGWIRDARPPGAWSLVPWSVVVVVPVTTCTYVRKSFTYEIWIPGALVLVGPEAASARNQGRPPIVALRGACHQPTARLT